MMEGQTATIDEHLHETKITNKKKEFYKTTELGFIPENWKIVKFEKVLSLFNGYAFKSTDAVESSNTQLIRMGNLYQNKLDLERKPIFYPDSYAQKYSKYVLHEGDLIISLTGTSEKEDYGFTVKINKTNKNLLLNQRVARIDIISADVNRDYIFYFLLSRIFLNPLFLTAKGMKQANLSTNAIKKLNIVIPPIEEQRKIARVLWLVQDAITQQDKLITITTELKKALMHKLFTERTPGKPQNWNIVKIEDAVEYIDYGLSQAIPKVPPENGVKIVSTADINREGQLLYSQVRHTEAPKKTIERLTLKEGDVLFNWRNSLELIGKTTIFEKQSEIHIFASFILRLRCDEIKTHNYYLKHLLNYLRECSVFYRLARRAVNQANYNKNEISALNIFLPAYNQQVEIASQINLIESKLNIANQKKQQLQDLFRTLLHQLMTAKIRVDDLNLSVLNVEPQGGEE